MKRYSDWTLFARIRVLILVALVPVLLFILFYLLPEIEDKLVLEKRAQTKNVVDVALNTLQYWNDQTLTHGVPIKEAQDKALQEISKIRYAGAEYFWVNDLEPRMIDRYYILYSRGYRYANRVQRLQDFLSSLEQVYRVL